MATRTSTQLPLNARRPLRAGHVSLLMVMVLMIGLSGLVLVVNWAFLLMAVQRTTQLTDVIAQSAVGELLDEGLLRDEPLADAASNQEDDVREMRAAVDRFLAANNAATPARLRLPASEVVATAGYVADVTAPVAARPLLETPPSGFLYNALRLEVTRKPGGAGSLKLLLRAFGGPESVKFSSSASAVLDNRLIGFRPSNSAAAPLAPLAINADAWFASRPAEGRDAFPAEGNGRFEMDAVLASPGGGGLANSALIGVNETNLDWTVLADQIKTGIAPGDLAPGKAIFGPATPGTPLAVPASDVSPSGRASPIDTDELVDAFLEVAASRDSRRIFPLFQGPLTNPLNLVGFVAADVLKAANTGVPGDDRLAVTIEPVFIVHFTAETDPALPDEQVNRYIYKLRLSR